MDPTESENSDIKIGDVDITEHFIEANRIHQREIFRVEDYSSYSFQNLNQIIKFGKRVEMERNFRTDPFTSGRRGRNFTERDKKILIEVVKDFSNVIDNKKTDTSSVAEKKEAWFEITRKFNACTDTGARSEKQLHALFDNLKKRARRNKMNDKCTLLDDSVVALLETHLQPVANSNENSATSFQSETGFNGTIEESSVVITTQYPISESQDDDGMDQTSTSESINFDSPPMSIQGTPEINSVSRKRARKKKKSIDSLRINKKKQSQSNNDSLTNRKLELLNMQIEQEKIKISIMNAELRNKHKQGELLDLQLEAEKLKMKMIQTEWQTKQKQQELVQIKKENGNMFDGNTFSLLNE